MIHIHYCTILAIGFATSQSNRGTRGHHLP